MRRLSALLLVACVYLTAQSNIGAQTQPVLLVEGDHFTINGVPKFLTLVSYFDALHASSSTWSTDLTYLSNSQQGDFDGVRIFPNWYGDYCDEDDNGEDKADDTLFRYNGTLNNDTLGKLTNFLDAAAAKGMIVDISFSRETVKTPAGQTGPMSVPNYQAALVAAAVALKDYKNVLFDVQNEYTLSERPAQHLTNAEVISIVGAIRAALQPYQATRILTASGGLSTAGADAKALGLDIVAYHDDRSTTWYQDSVIAPQVSGIKTALAAAPPAVKPIYFQEPQPWNQFSSTCTSSQKDPNPRRVEAVTSAKLRGVAAWTFHTRSAFNLSGSSLKAILDADSTGQKTELELIKTVANDTADPWGVAAFSVTPSAFGAVVVAGGGILSIGQLAAQTTWTAVPLAPWLHVSPSSGTGSSLGVTYDQNPTTATRVGQINVSGTLVTVTQRGRATTSDFDFDNRTDLGGYVRGTALSQWDIRRSTDGAVITTSWGFPNDIPVSADYDGDGRTDHAVFRPSEAKWYVHPSGAGVQFGLLNDIPVPGDYDGDGRTDLAVFRPIDSLNQYNNPGWYWRRSSDGQVWSAQWGLAGDIPVPADYNGDGVTDLAVFRPNASPNATWFVRQSPSGSLASVAWGLTGDIPAPADYNGDGWADLVVYRPSDQKWYVWQWGLGTAVFGLGSLPVDVPAAKRPGQPQ